MANALAEEKYELITRRLQEVLGGESLKAILDEGRSPKAYWGAFNVVCVCVLI
jgi:tyrosyl-tRNA synthetase